MAYAATFTAVALPAVPEPSTQGREYRCYKRNGWDGSVDSGQDRSDEQIEHCCLPLTSWQRLFLVRPAYIAMLALFVTMLMALG